MSMDDIFAEFEEEEEEKKGKVPAGTPEPPEPRAPQAPASEEAPAPPEEEAASWFGEPVEEVPAEVPPEPEVPVEEEVSWFGEAEEEEEEAPKPAEREAPRPPPPRPEPRVEEFDYSPAKPALRQTFMIYGEKGDGKTVLAFSYPGKIACLSFDRKSMPIKINFYKDSDRITVYDGIRYLNKTSPEAWLESAVLSFKYVNGLLEKIRKEEPDWIVIDGLEILVRDICEMTMRCRNNIQPFAGVELNLWKERNMYVDQIHETCLAIAKKGVIYTAYVDTKAVKIEKGKVVESTRQPKWAANVKYQVGNVIRVYAEDDPDIGRRFWAIVESSKSKGLRTGVRVDVTNGGIKKVLEASR